MNGRFGIQGWRVNYWFSIQSKVKSEWMNGRFAYTRMKSEWMNGLVYKDDEWMNEWFSIQWWRVNGLVCKEEKGMNGWIATRSKYGLEVGRGEIKTTSARFFLLIAAIIVLFSIALNIFTYIVTGLLQAHLELLFILKLFQNTWLMIYL